MGKEDLNKKISDEGDRIPAFEKRKSIKTSFPEVLMSVLDRDDTRHAIDWAPTGDSFAIVCPNTFTLEILPRFFKPTEMSTFTRRLYWWGFKKTAKTGSGQHFFYHEMFKRGNYDLCRKISASRSTSSKSKGLKRKKRDTSQEGRAELGLILENGLEKPDHFSQIPSSKHTKYVSSSINVTAGKNPMMFDNKILFPGRIDSSLLPTFRKISASASPTNDLFVKLQRDIFHLQKQIRSTNEVLWKINSV